MIAEKIYSTYRPKVLVGGKVRRFVENGFFYIAKKEGIKTISIIPVFISPDLNSYYDAGNFHIPDYIITWDTIQKRLIKEKFINRKNILAYGNSQLDIYNLKFDKMKIFDNQEDYILIATQGIWPIENVKDILEIAKKLNIRVIIKPHPKENCQKYYNKFKNFKNVLIINKNEDTYPLIINARAVLTGWSTTCMEARLFGTPTILYNKKLHSPSVEVAIKHYSKRGAINCTNKNDLEKILSYIISKKRTTIVKKKNIEATKKILKLIKTLIK